MAQADDPHSLTPNPEAGQQGINLFDPEAARCPQPIYAEMRAKCPVTRQLLTGSPVIARFDDVVWALRHPEIFSSDFRLSNRKDDGGKTTSRSKRNQFHHHRRKRLNAEVRKGLNGNL